MKKNLIIGLIILIIGGGIFCYGSNQLDWDYSKLDNQVYTEKTYTLSPSDAKVHTIDIDNINDKIVVTRGAEFSITYLDSEKDFYEITNENGLLKMHENTEAFKWFSLFTGLGKKSGISIVLPVDLVVTLNIDSTNSKIDISEGDFNGINIDVTNGDVTLGHITTDKFVGSAVNGKLLVNDSEIRSIEWDSTNGKVSLENISTDNVNISTVNGAVTASILGNQSDYDIEFSTISGHKSHSNQCHHGGPHGQDADKILDVSTVNGAIEFTFLK